MTWSIVRFELGNRFRLVSTYVYFATYFAFIAGSCVSAAGGSLTMDGPAVNSPFGLYYYIGGVTTLFGIPAMAAIAGQSIYQEFLHKTTPLLFATPIADRQLVLGRFLAATIVLLFVFLSAPLGCLAASLVPTVDPELMVANRFVAYLQAYLIVVAPNVVSFGAIFFAVAALCRNMLPVYLAALLIFVTSTSAGAMWTHTDYKALAGILDPLGGCELMKLEDSKTVAELNTQLVPISSVFVLNRLLWLGLAAAALGFAIYRIRIDTSASPKRRLSAELSPNLKSPVGSTVPVPVREPHPIELILRLAWQEWRSIVFRTPFCVTALAVVFLVFNAARFLGAALGTDVHLVTSNMLQIAQGKFVAQFVFFVTAIYAGQLVWREREANTSPMHDVLPLPSWFPFVAKLLALMMVQALLYVIVILCGVTIQASSGYFNFELDVYVEALLGIEWIRACLLCVLAMSVHVIVNHKSLGHVVVLFLYVAMQYQAEFGLEHHLLQYASHPDYTYSDMNGFGHFVWPIVVFNLYWASVATMIATLTAALWVRGADGSIRARLRQFRERFSVRHRSVAAIAFVSVIGLGGFIFYNTTVLNEYRSAATWEQQRVAYERHYAEFKHSAQPRIVAVNLQADIFPDDVAVRLFGTYQLENKTTESIRRVLVSLVPDGADVSQLSLGGVTQAIEIDHHIGVHVFELLQPMAPNARLPLTFDVTYRKRGFTNHQADSRIARNGTYIGVGNVPHVGYSTRTELLDNRVRRKHGLPPKPRVASISDLAARQSTLLGSGSDWIDFEATVSTSPEQIAIAPGALKREWTEGGRLFFHYKADAPMQFFFPLLSARYEVWRDRSNDIDVEIYYHKGHEYNVETMATAAKKSLEYYVENFGPYQNKQLRIVEVPRYHAGAMAFPGTIPFSESAGFITKPRRDVSRDLHYAYFTTAHEVAHQWWAHQVVGANVEGALMLSESLAQYSALTVMKQEYGPQVVKCILRNELDLYLRGRARAKEELPLVLDHAHEFVHYHKGALVLYALQDYLGEEIVNKVLADFVADKRFQQPPYTTSKELLQRFKEVTPDKLRYVIEDWFEKITLYDNRATSATYQRRDDGKYEVRLLVECKKLRGDRSVTETEIPVNDLVEVGVTDANGNFIYAKKHWFDKTKQEITLIVDREPQQAGIDPHVLLIDRQPDNNTVPISRHRRASSQD